jgi:hypothetical protein
MQMTRNMQIIHTQSPKNTQKCIHLKQLENPDRMLKLATLFPAKNLSNSARIKSTQKLGSTKTFPLLKFDIDLNIKTNT